jgi:mannosyltransferase
VARSPSTADTPIVLAAFALFMVALALNTWHLGARSLTFDEATSVNYTRMASASLADWVTNDEPNQSFYYAFLHGWLRAAGESEAAVRMPSAVAMALAASVVSMLGARLFGLTIGVWAGLLFATNAFIIRFAQTARAYGFLTVLTLVATLLLVDELARPSPRRRLAYVVIAVLSIHAHYFAALTLAAHAVILWMARAPWRTWLPVAAAIAVLSAPIAWVTAAIPPDLIMGWIPPLSPVQAWEVFTDFAAGSVQLLAALVALGCLGGAYAFGPGRRRSLATWRVAAGSRQVSPHLLLLAVLVVPIVLALAASSWQPMFVSHYLIACVPALFLLAASAWPALGRRAAPLVMGAVVALSLGRVPSYDAPARAENWRDASRHVLSARQATDVLLFVPEGARKPFDYYARQADVPESVRARDEGGHTTRVWLVIRDSDSAANQSRIDALHARLSVTHRSIPQPRFRRVTIELWEP